jgi:hypothetical protein
MFTVEMAEFRQGQGVWNLDSNGLSMVFSGAKRSGQAHKMYALQVPKILLVLQHMRTGLVLLKQH